MPTNNGNGNYVITEQGDLGLGLTPFTEQEDRTTNEEDERFKGSSK